MEEEKATQEQHTKPGNPYTGTGRRLIAGNPGRPKGTKDKAPRPTSWQLEKRVAQMTAQELLNSGLPHVRPVVEALAKHALGDSNQAPAAAAAFLKAVAPALPARHYVKVPEIAHMLPEVRMSAISALMAEGKLDIAGGQALIAAAKAEVEAGVIAPIRQALDALDRAVGADETRKAIVALAGTVRRLTGRDREQEVGESDG